MQWTDEEEKQLVELCKTKTYKEISILLHRQNAVIRIKCHKLKIHPIPAKISKEWSQEEEKQLVLLSKNGLTTREIAEILNRTIESVVGKAFLMKIKISRKKKISEKDIEEIKRLAEEGLGCKKISRLFSVCPDTINKIMRKHKIERAKAAIRVKHGSDFLEQIKDRLKIGKSFPEIAHELNVELNLINSYKRKYKLQTNITKISRQRADLALIGKSICGYCKQILPLTSDFFYSFHQTTCIECCNEIRNKRRKIFHSSGPAELSVILKERIRSCKRNACVKNLAFELTIESLTEKYRKQNGLCFYTGKPMELIIGKTNRTDTVSVDRIDSKIGYTNENVVLCRAKINCMKNEFSVDEFLLFCQQICEHHSNKFSNGTFVNH